MDLVRRIVDILTPEQWTRFGMWTAVWTGAYAVSLLLPIPLKGKYRKLSYKDELDVRNREISIIHGAIVAFKTGFIFFGIPQTCGRPNTDFEVDIMFLSMGYFAYDFLAMSYYGRELAYNCTGLLTCRV
jgi:hypothetical protein